MKVHKRAICLISCFFWVFFIPPCTTATGEDGPGGIEVQVEQLIREIKFTLTQVAASDEVKKLLELDSAVVNLETQMSVSGGGKLKLYVVSLDAKASEKTIPLK